MVDAGIVVVTAGLLQFVPLKVYPLGHERVTVAVIELAVVTQFVPTRDPDAHEYETDAATVVAGLLQLVPESVYPPRHE